MQTDPEVVHVLLIGGRTGVGKSTVGWEVSRRLQEAGFAHCYVEGDTLDQIFPAPPGDPLREQISEANLRALWANYAALGQRFLVYTNSAAVISADWMTRAVGGDVRFTGILLTAADAVAEQRLAAREIGSGLAWHAERGRRFARWIEAQAGDWVHRVPTDDRSVREIAAEIIALAGWLANPKREQAETRRPG